MITINSDLAYILLFLIGFYVFSRLFRLTIFPKIIEKTTKEYDKNPKWITSQLHEKHYGFNDIDFILAENTLGALPRFRVNKNDATRLEMLVPKDISTNDIEQIGQLALVGKIKIKYGLFFPDKPLNWLSVLCFMLEGGKVDIKEVEKDKKPIDDFQKV